MRYPRSDVQCVNIQPEHGGCGQQHLRPVNQNGEPVKVWAFDECPACEEAGARLMGWPSVPSKIELTPDEAEELERAEKEGSVVARTMAQAFAEQAARAVVETETAKGSPKTRTRPRKSA